MAGRPMHISSFRFAVSLLALVSFALGSASNALSRKVEANADSFSLRLTHDPAAFIALERKLTVTNVADPDPPALLQLLFGTHPTTRQRIGIGEQGSPCQRLVFVGGAPPAGLPAELAVDAVAPVPIAVEPMPDAADPPPSDSAPAPDALAALPSAMLFVFEAVAPEPTATLVVPDAVAPGP